VGTKAGGVGQGPAKGAGNQNPAHKLDTSSEAQSKRAQAGWIKRKMRAYVEANPDAAVTERTPSRVEIAELARAKMPLAVDKLELILHTSRSDMAAVQAFSALKDVAYGKDPQSLSVAMNFESMSEDELRAALLAEIGETDAESGGAAGGTPQA